MKRHHTQNKTKQQQKNNNMKALAEYEKKASNKFRVLFMVVTCLVLAWLIWICNQVRKAEKNEVRPNPISRGKKNKKNG